MSKEYYSNTMVSYRTQRILPVILVVIIGVAAFLLLLPAIQNMFGANSSGPSAVDISRANLTNTSADRSVRMTVRGPIVADEDFRSFQLHISPDKRVFNLYKGYQNATIKNFSLYNNIPAYEQFVFALNRGGLMDRSELTGERNDTRGVCASGNLYKFEMLKGSDVQKTLWTTSCSGSRGSLGNSGSQFITLFLKQIPKSQNIPLNASSVLVLK